MPFLFCLCLRINGHLGINHWRRHDRIRVRNRLWLFHHARITVLGGLSGTDFSGDGSCGVIDGGDPGEGVISAAGTGEPIRLLIQ